MIRGCGSRKSLATRSPARDLQIRKLRPAWSGRRRQKSAIISSACEHPRPRRRSILQSKVMGRAREVEPDRRRRPARDDMTKSGRYRFPRQQHSGQDRVPANEVIIKCRQGRYAGRRIAILFASRPQRARRAGEAGEGCSPSPAVGAVQAACGGRILSTRACRAGPASGLSMVSSPSSRTRSSRAADDLQE